MTSGTAARALRPRLARVVFVTRPTAYELLLDRYGTRGQVEFFLRSRGQSLESVLREHDAQAGAVRESEAALAPDRRRSWVDRDRLPHFLFEPGDIIVVIGQDGLVPNVAKYTAGQRVVGLNPDPARNDGILCRHSPAELEGILVALDDPEALEAQGIVLQPRTMARATLGDGQQLRALNELFVGHRSHQSARYELTVDGRRERQSSSGLICATGTGATGWARSIARQRNIARLPHPTDRRLAWMVREPFPSVATGTDLDFGHLAASEHLEVVSRMSEGGVVFADGIEPDYVSFPEGEVCRIEIDERVLRLVV